MMWLAIHWWNSGRDVSAVKKDLGLIPRLSGCTVFCIFSYNDPKLLALYLYRNSDFCSFWPDGFAIQHVNERKLMTDQPLQK